MKIYFWDITALKFDLVNRRVSNRQTLAYLICILSVQTVSWVFAFTAEGAFNLWDNIDAALFTAFLIAGTFYCYHANGGGKGSGFISRYVSLAWVFGVQYTVMVMMTSALVFYLVIYLFAGLPDETRWYDALFNAVLRVPFYLVLAGHLRDVALNRLPSEEEISRLGGHNDEDFDQSRYPTILRRYISASIDIVVILSIFVAFASIIQSDTNIESRTIIVFGIFILFLYEPVLTSRLCTIGQKITGIRIGKLDSGQTISILNACLRTMVKLLLGIISFFSIPVTRKRRALHDFAAGSVVIYAGKE